MKKIMALLITANVFTAGTLAQVYIEPAVGYQTDLNNKKGFKLLNTALQCSWKISKRYEFLVQLRKGLPFPSVFNDSSFTANPVLPVCASAKKTIRPSDLSFALGHRIKVAGKNTGNVLSVILYSGITSQKIMVNYRYDKNNYTILNPDQTQKRFSVFFTGGAEYMRVIKENRFFVQLLFATGPLQTKVFYPSSFRFITPLSFNAGYSVKIKKSKHEK
jgi:hypothetical protein